MENYKIEKPAFKLGIPAKVAIIVVIAVILRILLLVLLPLRQTTELPPLSMLSAQFGMIPIMLIMITFLTITITLVLVKIQNNLKVSRTEMIFRSVFSFTLICFLAVLETVPSLGKPIEGEILIAFSDIIPIIFIGILSAFLNKNYTKSNFRISALFKNIHKAFIITAVYFVGRYLLYAIINVQSGYSLRPGPTFIWTLLLGFSIGLLYIMLEPGIKSDSIFKKALIFGLLIFGVYWTLNNLFMPVVFDMSSINFNPPFMNYVFRFLLDILFVITGVWLSERRT